MAVFRFSSDNSAAEPVWVRALLGGVLLLGGIFVLADIMLVKHTARTLDGITIRLIDHLVLAGPHTVSLHQMGLL